jgi:hypothetical protein
MAEGEAAAPSGPGDASADRTGWVVELGDRRRNLVATLGFLQLKPTEPELQMLHCWLDTWEGLGLVTVGVERLGYRLSLSHIAEGEWRAHFSEHPMWASAGYGVAPTPWGAVQLAAWAAVKGSMSQ